MHVNPWKVTKIHVSIHKSMVILYPDLVITYHVNHVDVLSKFCLFKVHLNFLLNKFQFHSEDVLWDPHRELCLNRHEAMIVVVSLYKGAAKLSLSNFEFELYICHTIIEYSNLKQCFWLWSANCLLTLTIYCHSTRESCYAGEQTPSTNNVLW